MRKLMLLLLAALLCVSPMAGALDAPQPDAEIEVGGALMEMPDLLEEASEVTAAPETAEEPPATPEPEKLEEPEPTEKPAKDEKAPWYGQIWKVTTEKREYTTADGNVVVKYTVSQSTSSSETGAYYVCGQLINVVNDVVYSETVEFFAGRAGDYTLNIPLKGVPTGVYDMSFNLLKADKTPLSQNPEKVSIQVTNTGAPIPTAAPITENAFKNVKVGGTAINDDTYGIQVSGDLEMVKGGMASIIISIHRVEDADGNAIYDYVNAESFYEQKTGPFSWVWNLLDAAGRRVANGKFEISISAKQTYYSDYFYNKKFTVSVDDPPKLNSAALGAEKYWIEYATYPTVTVSASRGTVAVKVLNAKGSAIRTINTAVKKDTKTAIAWDLKNSSGAVVAPGDYTFEITAKNDIGVTKAVTRKFTLIKRPAPTLTITASSNSIVVNTWNTIEFTLAANQGLKYKLEILNSSGSAVETFNKTLAKNSSFSFVPTLTSGYYKPGTYTFRATATALNGGKKTVNQKFTLKAATKVTLSSAKLSKTTIYAGDALSFSVKTNTKAHIYLYGLNSSGNVAFKMSAWQVKGAGTQTVNIGTSGLAAGQYTVIFKAQTGNNTATVQKTLTVKKKTVPKMQIHSLKAEWIDDVVGGYNFYTDYSGSGTLYLSVTRNSTGKTVWTTSKKVTSGGTWKIGWSFQTDDWQTAPPGRYTVTVYGVNAGGNSAKKSATIDVN